MSKPSPGIVYIVQCEQAYKIGFTRHGLARRVRDAGGKLLLTIPVKQRPSCLEYIINHRFADKRIDGYSDKPGGKREWFNLDAEDLAWLQGLAAFLAGQSIDD